MAPRRKSTDSALAVAREALLAGEAAYPRYSHRNSPKTYTLAQLFAVLMVRQFLGLDLRRTERLVAEWSDLREALGLKQAPDHSTLCRAERKLLKKGALTGSTGMSSGPRAAAA
jgi:hypothetical protein